MGTWTVPGPSPVTFNTTPSGLSLQVDGVTYTTPVTLQLSPGNHRVNASIAQGSPAGTRYIFHSWSDSGAAQHTVTTPAAGFTANFTTQYQLTTSANPAAGGTVNPASNWYDLGTPATVTANPNSGYLFTGFSGSTTSTANPFTFTINGPNNLIAGFSVAPPTVSITPPSGAGASQILTAVYIDPVAYGQITEALLLVNSSASTASACYVKWTPGNHFYLRNETDSAWMEGTAASVENSRCRLDAPANGAKGVGQTLTVNFGLTFFSPFSGAKQVYLTTTTGLGTASWQAKGTWTVDRTSGDYTVTAITPSAAGAHMATVQFQYAVRAIGGIDGSTVRVRNQGVYIQNTLNCLGGWNQQGGWDPATRTGTVTLWITLANGCYDQTTFTPEVSWESGGGSGVSKTTTDTTFTCCITAPVSITITPTSTTLRAGQYVRLTAKVEGTDNKNVTWNNPTNGTIDNTGYAMVIYTAPASISTTQYVVLTAHSNQDPSKVASATITLQPAAPTEVPKYVISGTVTQADGSAFGPISINVTGDQAQTVSTLPDGTYSTPSLPAGHYTVKPSSDYGAATPTTYDLVEPRSGNHVMKPFRISPNNVFPPVDESPVESRGVLSVTANGIPKAYDFWWTNSHINSLDIQWPGCWVKPIGSSASYSNSDQSIEVSYTPDASGPHFVITFKAPVNAVLGFRDVVCRYGGKDVVGWDIISIEAAPVVVSMKLEQVGPTVISTDGNYSEDTTIRVTAVDAVTGANIPDFVGTVNIAEIPTPDGITLYSQNGGTLTPNNTGSVNITTGGSVTFVARSLAGPLIEGNVQAPPYGVRPNNATIQTINYPVRGPNLTIPQWITTGPARIDPLASGSVFDWFQTRARDVVAQANSVVPPLRNDLALVFATVNSYLVGPISSAGYTPTSHNATSQVTINPYYTVHRINGGYLAPCGFANLKGFQGTLFHEARHAYQFAQSSIGNDPDQDYLVNVIAVPADDTIPPGDYFKDSQNPRLVCNPDAIVIPFGKIGQIQQAVFSGSLVFDAFEPLVRYALEMDAYTFAANWAR